MTSVGQAIEGILGGGKGGGHLSYSVDEMQGNKVYHLGVGGCGKGPFIGNERIILQNCEKYMPMSCILNVIKISLHGRPGNSFLNWRGENALCMSAFITYFIVVPIVTVITFSPLLHTSNTRFICKALTSATSAIFYCLLRQTDARERER